MFGGKTTVSAVETLPLDPDDLVGVSSHNSLTFFFFFFFPVNFIFKRNIDKLAGVFL